jgi:uncharacterized protein YbjT (DUF2867 family)
MPRQKRRVTAESSQRNADFKTRPEAALAPGNQAFSTDRVETKGSDAMADPLILVTGATGTVGTELVKRLAESNARVRVLTRDAGKAQKFGKGLEVCQGDLEKSETLPAAFAGVDEVFVLSAGLQLAVMEGNAYVTAKNAGVRHIVKLCGRHVNADFMAGEPHVQAHADSEQHLQSLGVPWTILRPTAFASNFLAWLDRKHGGIFLPAGEGKDTFIDPRDIAECAARLLTNPGHDGRIYEVTSSEQLSFAQAADKISAATGRNVIYQDVPEETARRGMLAAGVHEDHVAFILRYFAAVRNRKMYPPTSAVADLLGRPPRTFDEWARDHADALRM